LKIPFPVSLDEDLAEWINSNSKKGNFRNRSHLVEAAINEFRKKFDQDPLEVKENQNLTQSEGGEKE
jgi:Arc/MetJ-type ribon-helix-helix transcriptional regulator